MISRKLPCIAAVIALLAAGLARAGAPVPADGVGPALEHLLAAEFALQSGHFDEAARHYDLATAASDDPVVAERATHVALMARDLDQAERNLARWERLAPDSTEPAGAALQIHLLRGEGEAAGRDARRMLAARSGWKKLLGLLSQPSVDGGGAARTALRAAVEDPAFPTAVEAGLAFAGLARKLDEPAVARDIGARLAAAHPEDPRVLVAGATLDREAGAPAAARRQLDRALSLPMDDEVRSAAAGELEQLGDPKGAARLLAQGPQDDTSYMLRAAWLYDAGDTAGLAALDKEIQADGLNPARQLLLGQIAEVRSDWAGAERWYRGIVGGRERDRARLRVAAMLERQGQAAAGADWLRALEGDSALDGEDRRDAFLFEAELWARQEDDAQSLAAYARGLEMFEDDPVLLYGRAMQHVRRERIDEGLGDLHRILEVDADHPEALNAYGYTLAEFKQRYAEALPYVEKSNRLRPGSAATLDSLGWIRLKLGDAAAAMPLLREAWSREQDPEIAAHLGEALWLAGDRAEARRIWARGRELDKDNKALRAMLEKYGR